MDARPEFLNDKREKIFCEVGKALNLQLQQDKIEKGHLQEHMSNYMKSQIRRAWLGGTFGDYFSGDEGVLPRHDQNMLALQIDDWFCRVIKIEILDADNPPKHPKTIRRAIKKALEQEDEPEQLSLFTDEDLPAEKRIVPLEHLRQGIIGYFVDLTGLIIGFGCAEFDETGFYLQNIYFIDLNAGLNAAMTVVPVAPEFDPSNSSTSIKIKPSYTPPEQDEDKAQ
jgi:hypothetical protein